MTPARLLFALVVIGVGAGAFAAGRASVDRKRPASRHDAFRSGYLAGREAAFGTYDGGWSYGEPYIVVLRRGGPGITYRIARRWPMRRGVEYRACRRTVCSRSAR